MEMMSNVDPPVPDLQREPMQAHYPSLPPHSLLYSYMYEIYLLLHLLYSYTQLIKTQDAELDRTINVWYDLRVCLLP